ncbi:hypothetical protein JN11_01876 [Mucilaginibacter frigoritolerans]|jgi:hypothetical protein|uniref:Uncharacterized protein n=1 Tax=Mucilaginibacter frigoritolerans TaxID=652788 RepID=A0A562U4A6_9SPHI|nr:hypothetical protein [Mucilaginibacter frigoritolerans]TWJ00620.1 hypothetical protein JN11_01876 [Mucilaginibacter frigoritolerans]
MPHIELESHLPGITGLLEYRRDTGEPIRVLTQVLLQEVSTLTGAERELIANVISHDSQCRTAAYIAADLELIVNAPDNLGLYFTKNFRP